MANICLCDDWKKNIDKLNSGFAISYIHGLGGYTGKQFEYCGWCGKKLVEQIEEQNNENK